MSADFDLLFNGGPAPNKLVIPSNSFETRQLTVRHKNGAAAAGKLVQIDTSSLLYISAVVGNLDSTGQFAFTVGPGFGLRGDVTLTISAGSNKKRTISVDFV